MMLQEEPKVQESEIELATADGSMNSWFFRPGNGDAVPAVLLYMDAPGIREELKDMARTICRAGYAVLLPNLYYRTNRQVDFSPERFAASGDSLREEMLGKVRSLTFAMLLRDTAAMLDFLAARSDIAGSHCAAVGYCMSGRWVVAAATAFPDRFATVASFYGTGLVTDQPDSPHLRIHETRCELYFAFAENDIYVPASQVDALRERLSGTGAPHTIEVYPGTSHGFAFRRGNYHPQADERHWKAIFDLLAKRLPTGASVS